MEELPTKALSNGFLDMLKVFMNDDLSEFYYKKQDGKWRGELK